MKKIYITIKRTNNNSNNVATNNKADNANKADSKKKALQTVLCFFLYFIILLGLCIIRSVFTDLISTGELVFDGVSLSVAVVQTIFSLPNAKIKEFCDSLPQKISSKKASKKLPIRKRVRT